MRDYYALCERCHYCLAGDAYQAAEAIAHQLGGDEVHCPGCGLKDWSFEAMEESSGAQPQGVPAARQD